MMALEIFEFDAAWAEKWTKTGVSFLSAPTVSMALRKDVMHDVIAFGYAEI